MEVLTRDTCPECKGTGKIKDKPGPLDQYYKEPLGDHICTTCGGSGKVKRWIALEVKTVKLFSSLN